MEYIIEGFLAVKAAIEGKNREVVKVLIDENKKSRKTNYLYYLCKSNDIEINYVTSEIVSEYISGKTSGGILAIVKERKYQKLEDILAKDVNYLAVLDGIEDPYNFAYCIRSLYASGCQAIIVGKRNFNNVVEIVVKSSGGASELIDMVVVDDIATALLEVKKHNISIYCGNRKDAKSLYKTTFDEKILIAIGGEKRGLSKQVVDCCDYNIYIPYANNFKNAINGSSATAIISFEVLRQRGLYEK